MVSTHPPASKSSRPFNNPLVIVPNAPITIGTIVTFMFHSFFNSLARSRYLSFFSLSFRFILWSAGTAKSTLLQILFFLLIIMRSGLLARIRWSVYILKSHRNLCESFSRTGAWLYIYHLFVWSNWNFLHISQWITLPTQLYLALYSFCANLLHSLIMWLIVSSLSQENYLFHTYSLQIKKIQTNPQISLKFSLLPFYLFIYSFYFIFRCFNFWQKCRCCWTRQIDWNTHVTFTHLEKCNRYAVPFPYWGLTGYREWTELSEN